MVFYCLLSIFALVCVFTFRLTVVTLDRLTVVTLDTLGDVSDDLQVKCNKQIMQNTNGKMRNDGDWSTH